jgi:hypothetical protein
MRDETLKELGKFFLIVIVIAAVVELVFFGWAMVTADYIECNLMYCKAVKENASVHSHVTRSCSMNGRPINCSEWEREEKRWEDMETAQSDGRSNISG